MKTKLLPYILNHGTDEMTHPAAAQAGRAIPCPPVEVRLPIFGAHGGPSRTGQSHPTWAVLLLCALWLATTFTAQAAPVVTNVTTQLIGTLGTNVNISYNISDANFSYVNVYVLASPDSGTNWTVPVTSVTGGGVGAGVSSNPNSPHNVYWNAGADWPGHYTTNCRVRVVACDNGMVMIPAGSYIRGNYVAMQGSGDSDITDAPTNSVFINPFLMDSNLVSYSQWQTVFNWATNHGYGFDNAGSGNGANYPVVNINWADAAKWCNARSEMEGITPAYTSNPGQPYRTGPSVPSWAENGISMDYPSSYRLPTEAEWEKAARGGLSGQRFPWGNTISESQANYLPGSGQSYDSGGTQTYSGGTSPVGSFPANGYGLFDMAGNVNEWCWDRYSSTYYASGQINPTGPTGRENQGGLNATAVLRGGSWADNASVARCAARNQKAITSGGYDAGALNTIGFRCVRGF